MSNNYKSFKLPLIAICIAAAAAVTCFSTQLYAEDGNIAFYPTWKLLKSSEKAQFISGYLHGWADARNVTKIAIDYIRENPDKAVNSLEEVRKLYDVSLLRPEQLVSAIDSFYESPQNKASPLSMAVTAAKLSLVK